VDEQNRHTGKPGKPGERGSAQRGGTGGEGGEGGEGGTTGGEGGAGGTGGQMGPMGPAGDRGRRGASSRLGLIGYLILTLAVVVAFWRLEAIRSERAVDVSRSDALICQGQNANREALRNHSRILLRLVGSVLASDGPTDPKVRAVFEEQLAELEAEQGNLRPRNCRMLPSQP
jgi:hypothetical protein